MKKLIGLMLTSMMFIGCSYTQTNTIKTYDTIEHRIPVKTELELEYIQTLEFTVPGLCSEGRAVAFARQKKFADELGSITMRQTKVSVQKVNNYDSGPDYNDKVFDNESGVTCEYTALGFKVLKRH